MFLTPQCRTNWSSEDVLMNVCDIGLCDTVTLCERCRYLPLLFLSLRLARMQQLLTCVARFWHWSVLGVHHCCKHIAGKFRLSDSWKCIYTLCLTLLDWSHFLYVDSDCEQWKFMRQRVQTIINTKEGKCLAVLLRFSLDLNTFFSFYVVVFSQVWLRWIYWLN